MGTTFFTSDTHYSHKRIIEFCNRPFASAEEMNEEMVKRWNSVVRKGDITYHTGDFAFCSDIKQITSRLNGSIHLLRGNHDIKRITIGHLPSWYGFAKISDYQELPRKRYGQKIVLSHYPMQTWNQSHHGSYHLHGHCHGGVDNLVNGKLLRRLDVGVDSHDFTPIAFEDVQLYMESIEVEALTER